MSDQNEAPSVEDVRERDKATAACIGSALLSVNDALRWMPNSKRSVFNVGDVEALVRCRNELTTLSIIGQEANAADDDPIGYDPGSISAREAEANRDQLRRERGSRCVCGHGQHRHAQLGHAGCGESECPCVRFEGASDDAR